MLLLGFHQVERYDVVAPSTCIQGMPFELKHLSLTQHKKASFEAPVLLTRQQKNPLLVIVMHNNAYQLAYVLTNFYPP